MDSMLGPSAMKISAIPKTYRNFVKIRSRIACLASNSRNIIIRRLLRSERLEVKVLEKAKRKSSLRSCYRRGKYATVQELGEAILWLAMVGACTEDCLRLMNPVCIDEDEIERFLVPVITIRTTLRTMCMAEGEDIAKFRDVNFIKGLALPTVSPMRRTISMRLQETIGATGLKVTAVETENFAKRTGTCRSTATRLINGGMRLSGKQVVNKNGEFLQEVHHVARRAL